MTHSGSIAGTATYKETSLLIRDQPLTFGRDPGTDITVGRGSFIDDVIPRLAGHLTATDGRIAVVNLCDRLAFDIVAVGAAPVAVRPGMMVSPPEPGFDVVLSGVVPYAISVNTNTKGTVIKHHSATAELTDDLPTGMRIALTERQDAVLEAYVAPVLSGGSPASHNDVASQLHLSRSTVRIEANQIWSAMLLEGVPLRDFDDNIDQIVDAWLRHRL